MYTLDLNDPDAKPRLMERDGPSDFVPHGISLLEEEQLLFVISHPSTGHTVEVFKIEENRLAHLRTITSELFIEPNDIVAFKPDTFYVSNFQNARDGIGLTVERYLGLPVTNIVQFADGQASIAVDGLVSANGVNISKDGSELYVAELLAQKMNTFQRDPATGKLGKRQRFSIGTAADNIDVGSDGDLYIATHPNLLAFAAHAENENATSPSQIIRINPSTHAQETVFMSIDGEFNGSSVGAFWEGNLLLGNVHDPQIMRCSL
ncbi:strictosidine synthase family protein [uncultured Erythrobacter sp.]|nr:SMP-30/gluconolactonase/LRE family protein [uncultured Erythrobacter sp.]